MHRDDNGNNIEAYSIQTLARWHNQVVASHTRRHHAALKHITLDDRENIDGHFNKPARVRTAKQQRDETYIRELTME